MRFACIAALAVALYGLCTGSAKAGTVFQETFDTGSAANSPLNPYWLDPSQTNNFIFRNSGSMPPGNWSDAIPADVSGTGYFLFEGTSGDNPDSSGSYADEFYVSSVFAVVPNSLYTVSFYLANEDDIHVASVQREINGSLLGAPVSAQGNSWPEEWQQFSFTWNSGSNTSASLVLNDFTTAGSGNDFGIDNISVSGAAPQFGDPTPEPGTLALVAVPGILLALLRRKRATQV